MFFDYLLVLQVSLKSPTFSRLTIHEWLRNDSEIEGGGVNQSEIEGGGVYQSENEGGGVYQSENEGGGVYQTSLFITRLSFIDTGEYVCQYKQAANQKARIYVYVSGTFNFLILFIYV